MPKMEAFTLPPLPPRMQGNDTAFVRSMADWLERAMPRIVDHFILDVKGTSDTQDASITTNTTNIATNATDIATNAEDIDTLEANRIHRDGSIDFTGDQSLADNALTNIALLRLLERSADPAEPAEGSAVIWMSDGTEKGDDGDVLIASKAAGTTKWATLFDHSAGGAW